MSDYGVYDKYIQKLKSINKKHGTYYPDSKPEPHKPLNPLSDFLKDKDGKPVLSGEARITKMGIFSVDEAMGVKAITESGSSIKLGSVGAKLENVDRINGIWHVQIKFPYEITRVRKQDMVLIKKLDRVESTGFEFYAAKSVGYNCFGPFLSSDYVVAKCDTDDGPFWGYGKTMDDARAYLCLKLYGEYQDIILSIACRKTRNKNK